MIRTSWPTALVLALGCGSHDGDGDGTTGASFTTVYSAGDPSTASATFTNTSDPTEDPTQDPSAVSDDDPSAAPTTDPDSADASSTAVAEGSSTSGETSTGSSSSNGESSSSDGGSSSGGACCDEQDGPGCGDAGIERCVCATESFCCDEQWDLFCTVQVVLLACDSCPGIGGDGDCCSAHDGPGCDDDAIEACVCEQDLVCCTEAWDELCVEAVADRCGGC